MIQTLGHVGYLIVAAIFAYYCGKTYFNQSEIEYGYEAGYMCVIAPIVGMLWPLLIVFGILRTIVRKIL